MALEVKAAQKSAYKKEKLETIDFGYRSQTFLNILLPTFEINLNETKMPKNHIIYIILAPETRASMTKIESSPLGSTDFDSKRGKGLAHLVLAASEENPLLKS